MWIVLLDHSGSMGEPFSARITGISRRVLETDVDIKLAAAKEVLIEEIDELGADVPLVLFGFTSETHLVFEGAAGQKDAIKLSLGLLKANDGTSIAAALNAAADYRSSCVKDDLARIVLISDGKSDRNEAKAAARRCLEFSMAIHFILIDPTEEGKAFARDVVGSVGGTSFTVASRAQLKESAKIAEKEYKQDLARAKSFLLRSDEQAAFIRVETENRDRVEFTAGYPGRIRPNYNYSMIVWVHREGMEEEIKQRLSEKMNLLGEMPRCSQAESTSLIPVGTRLEITPQIIGVNTNPSQQQLTWFGEIEEVVFQIQRSESQGVMGICAGFIDVSASGLLIAKIPVSISISETKERLSWQSSTAQMIKRVFASYAREDLSVVRGCKAAYNGLGIHLFIDKDEILAGEPWRDVIRRSIGSHDLFQLFWSQHSADSTWVSNEWHLAVSIASQRNEDFIRPLYWTEPMVNPPKELADINFTFLDLKALNIVSEQMDQVDMPPFNEVLVDFPVIDVIGCGDYEVAVLCHDMSKVVSFLEHLLSARYYPPVSFVVDEHTVQTAHQTVPSFCRDEHDGIQGGSVTNHVIDLLQSLALAFHVGRIVPKDMSREQRNVFFDVLDDQAEVEFRHVIQRAEGVFHGPVRQYFGGHDILRSNVQSMQSCLELVARNDESVSGCSGYRIKDMLEWLLDVASGEDSQLVKSNLTQELLEDLSSFHAEQYKRAARYLLNTPIPQLAEKYQVYIFFRDADRTEFRLCRTFPEYVSGFCARWLSYIDTALRKQGDVIVDIGYSVPLSALEWLKKELPGIQICREAELSSWTKEEPQVKYDLGLSDYRMCVQHLSDLLLRLLDQRDDYIGRTVLPVAASTYGVFLPAYVVSAQFQFEATLTKFGWPKKAGLDGHAKVLICSGAIERIKQMLADSDETKTRDLARRIALAVLVHEHFHAAVAMAIDRDGRLPVGTQRRDDWQEGGALNEALAVWAERHFFRIDSEMSSHIKAYIKSGNYPNWPYRGADFLEEVFRNEGLPAVRSWIKYLRDDPANAQKDFDRQVDTFQRTTLTS